MSYGISAEKKIRLALKMFVYGDAKGSPVKHQKAEEMLSYYTIQPLFITDNTIILYRFMQQLRHKKDASSNSYLIKAHKDANNNPYNRVLGLISRLSEKPHLSFETYKDPGALLRVPAFCCQYILRCSKEEILYQIEQDTKSTHKDLFTVWSSLYYFSLFSLLLDNKIKDFSYEGIIDSILVFLSNQGFTLNSKYTYILSNSLESLDIQKAEQVLPYIIYLLASYKLPRDIMQRAICIDGDSAAVGALVGFLLPFIFDESIIMEDLLNFDLQKFTNAYNYSRKLIRAM